VSGSGVNGLAAALLDAFGAASLEIADASGEVTVLVERVEPLRHGGPVLLWSVWDSRFARQGAHCMASELVDGELARLVADAVAAKSSTGAAHAAAKAILARGRSS
jgi:hypothetical protein